MKNGQHMFHLTYMDDIKLISANKEGLNVLLKTMEKFSEDTILEFCLIKCKINAMKKGIWEKHPGFNLEPEKTITSMDKEEIYKYLGLDQARGIKHKDMKEILRKNYWTV